MLLKIELKNNLEQYKTTSRLGYLLLKPQNKVCFDNLARVILRDCTEATLKKSDHIRAYEKGDKSFIESEKRKLDGVLYSDIKTVRKKYGEKQNELVNALDNPRVKRGLACLRRAGLLAKDKVLGDFTIIFKLAQIGIYLHYEVAPDD